MESRQQQHNPKHNIQCDNCKRYGHVKAECWFKERAVNVAEEQDVSNLLSVGQLISSGYSVIFDKKLVLLKINIQELWWQVFQ